MPLTLQEAWDAAVGVCNIGLEIPSRSQRGAATGTTRGSQIGDPIGERLEQPIEHRLGPRPRVTAAPFQCCRCSSE